MIIYNIIKNGSEYQLLDKELPVPEGWTVEAETVNEQYIEDYINAPITIPAVLTMRQARLALLGAGLLGNVETAIAGLPSPLKEAALIEWEYSNEVQRHNGFVEQLAPLLGLTSQQIDALFIQAAQIV